MTAALKAAVVYCIAGFAFGFLLGVIRVSIFAPRTGALLAVLIEVPIMLAALWPLCGIVIRQLEVPRNTLSRLVMGGAAFALLMVVEVVFSKMIFSQSPMDFIAGLTTSAGALGLAGQVTFGLFPMLRMSLTEHR